MKLKLSNFSLLFWASLLITISNSQYFIENGKEKILEYAGLAILLAGIYFRNNLLNDWKKLLVLLLVMFFFSIGLMQQQLDINKKYQLIISMFILASLAIVPCKYVKDIGALRLITNGVWIGICCSIVLALFNNMPLTTKASEGIIVNMGFNGGMSHRNYFSYTVLVIVICEYILCRYLSDIRRKNFLIMSMILLVITNSRSAIILLFIFLVLCNHKRISNSRHKRKIWGVCIIFLFALVGIPMYKYLMSISETFFFRINGLLNYISKYKNDMFHLIFGNAEMAFVDNGLRYDENIRFDIGWDGSVELVVLNVLIKNGLLGFIGYFIIFKSYFDSWKKLYDNKLSIIVFSVLITFLISACVESYVADIKHIYTVFCYLLLSNLSNFNLSYKYKKDNDI